MGRISLLFPPTLLLAVWTGGCGRVEPSGPIPVVVSILPHAYLVKRIGGDRVKVHVLVAPGESPATYQPSDREVSELLRARAYFKTGVPFERGPWSRVLHRAGKRLRIVDLREGIALRDIGAEGRRAPPARPVGLGDTRADPHVWLSPPLLKIQARHVARILSAVDAPGASRFAKNLEAFSAEMDALDGKLRKLLAPLKGKSLFVYHPSWGYFCDTYGLVQVSIEREGKAPSDAELTRLCARIRAAGTRVLFVQPQIAGATASAVAAAAGVDTAVLDPLAEDVPSNLLAVARAVVRAYPVARADRDGEPKEGASHGE